MAIRKRGKQGLYCAYFRGLDERPDGSLVMVTREVCLHTSDAVTAAALDQQLREREKKHRAELRARAFARQLLDDSPDAPPVHAVTPTVDRRPRRLRLDAALDAAEKYAPVSDTVRRVWSRFARSMPVQYCDELTAPMIHGYLERYARGKTYNNVRNIVGRVLSLTRMESGLEHNPVDVIPTRRSESDHQRPIALEEFLRLHAAAPEPWRTAVLIAWHTGLRQKDVATLRWSEIRDGAILHTPGKTARFGRAVEIPVHPQLAAALAALPRNNDFVLGQWWPAGSIPDHDRRRFAALLASCGIASNASGIVNFNSLRDSLVSRLDAAGIPRHAIRGMVGHVSDDTTDLYSHDLTTARRILDLPAPDIQLSSES
jgi:integrase